MSVLAAYRRTGADAPYGDLHGAHGTGFEGYFWRVTHPATETVVVVLAGISLDRQRRPWGTVGLAAHPGGVVLDAVVDHVTAEPTGIGFEASGSDGFGVQADDRRLRLSAGARAELDITLREDRVWPRGGFGALGPAQLIPGLSQYWHPHLLHATASGHLDLDGTRIDLDGASVYAEKNWGAGGFPPVWWWGQAHGFAEPTCCVAFAGGRAGVAGLKTTATSLVLAHPTGVLRFVRPLTPIAIDVGAEGWRLRARSARHTVVIEGHANGSAPHLLPVPIPLDRAHLPNAAAQHLAGALTVTVTRGRRVLWRDESTLAGLEQGTVVRPERDITPTTAATRISTDPHILVARASQP